MGIITAFKTPASLSSAYLHGDTKKKLPPFGASVKPHAESGRFKTRSGKFASRCKRCQLMLKCLFRMFVAGKDIPGRRVFLAQGTNHPALFTHSALLSRFEWLAGEPPAQLAATGSFDCTYMARYASTMLTRI